jgi:hypothetical protein
MAFYESLPLIEGCDLLFPAPEGLWRGLRGECVEPRFRAFLGMPLKGYGLGKWSHADPPEASMARPPCSTCKYRPAT